MKADNRPEVANKMKVRALKRALELLSGEDSWVKDVLATNEYGKYRSFNAVDACKFCAIGAVHRASWDVAGLQALSRFDDDVEDFSALRVYYELSSELMALADSAAQRIGPCHSLLTVNEFYGLSAVRGCIRYAVMELEGAPVGDG